MPMILQLLKPAVSADTHLTYAALPDLRKRQREGKQ